MKKQYDITNRIGQTFSSFIEWRLWMVCCMLLIFHTGCNDDSFTINYNSVEENNMITFEIRIPQNSIPYTTGTRAMTAEQELAIQEMDILVFESSDGNFLSHTSGKLITRNPEGSDADYRFTAMLEEIASCDMVLIANAHTAVKAFLTAQGVTPFSKTNLQAGLILENNNSIYFDNDGKWDVESPAFFPMWGELLNRQIVKESVVDGVTLHRMIARINISVDADNFDLREVYLYNSVTKGSIIPDASCWDATWKPGSTPASDPAVGKATTPTISSGWGRVTQPLAYTYQNAEVQDKSCTNEIYTFETPTGDGTSGPDNTFLVIGGLYDGSTTVTYYRVDIAEENQTDVYEYLPLLRNHTYDFTVNSVARKGYASPDIAATAGPENVEVVLVIENDSELRYYISDSHYYAGVTERVVRIPYNTSVETHSLKIKTNYTAGWSVKVSDSETDPDIPCTWITLNTSFPSTGEVLSYTITPNDAWAVRRGFLHISAGVELVVVIEQDSKDAVELPTLTPIGNIPSAGQSRTVRVTGLFDTPILVRVRNKYDTQTLDSKSVPANAPDGLPASATLSVPAWWSDDPRTLVFEYQDPGSSEWVTFYEDIQLGYDFDVSTTLPEGGVIPEKPGTGDYTVSVTGSSWPVIYVRAINRSSLEPVTDPITIAAGNDGTAKTATVPVHAYGQWNDQAARNIELQWSKDNINWTTIRSGIQKGWYRITGASYKIYHPGTTERTDISHDGARVVVTVEGDFPAGVVELRLGSSDVQVERSGGDGISANTPTELFCRYNRTLLTRTVPLSYRLFVNNAWQTWEYEQSGTGNIRTFTQPSITCELPTTGRIIARDDCFSLYYPSSSSEPYLSAYVPWATAMGIDGKYNRSKYEANISTGDYPTYGGYGESSGYPNGGCSLYYEGNDPDDPVRGQGKWYVWGDGKTEYDGEAQFFVQPNSTQLNNLLGLNPGTEYWTYMRSGNADYMQTLQIYENRWSIAYKYKPLLLGTPGYDIRTRCVRYPTAEEKEQFEKGYAPNVVTTY